MAADTQRWPTWRYAVLTVPLILGLGFLSGELANAGYGNPWFDALQKPGIMPPGWAFPLAWSLLYILLGLALALVLRRRGAPGRAIALTLFAAQMLLNFAWTPVFFGLHRPEAALFLIVLMLALTIPAAFLFGRISRAAGWMMLAYLGWLAFASLLNYRIIELNPGA